MTLIEDQSKAHKAYSVLFPFLATTITLLISMITSLSTSGVIDINNDIYWGYALTGLTYAGRVIKQVDLFTSVAGSISNTGMDKSEN